jgi:hypothetical protein
MQVGDIQSHQQGMHAVAVAHDRPAGIPSHINMALVQSIIMQPMTV